MDQVSKKRKQFRTIYETLHENPRIPRNRIAENLNVCKQVLYRKLKEAMNCKIIMGPEIRKRSYRNLREYMYFVKCEDAETEYLKCCKNPSVIYNAFACGFCDLWVIAKDKIDIDGNIIIEGYRSDYHVSYAPDYSWEKALDIMKKRVENFNCEDYTPKGIIETHLNEEIPWDEKDEILYRTLKYYLKNRTSRAMEEYKIPVSKLNRFYRNLPERCTIATHYFPDGYLCYDPYLYMLKTDYEDFIIELFSQLPTSSTFFKLSGTLFLHIYVAYLDQRPHSNTPETAMRKGGR